MSHPHLISSERPVGRDLGTRTPNVASPFVDETWVDGQDVHPHGLVTLVAALGPTPPDVAAFLDRMGFTGPATPEDNAVAVWLRSLGVVVTSIQYCRVRWWRPNPHGGPGFVDETRIPWGVGCFLNALMKGGYTHLAGEVQVGKALPAELSDRIASALLRDEVVNLIASLSRPAHVGEAK